MENAIEHGGGTLRLLYESINIIVISQIHLFNYCQSMIGDRNEYPPQRQSESGNSQYLMKKYSQFYITMTDPFTVEDPQPSQNLFRHLPRPRSRLFLVFYIFLQITILHILECEKRIILILIPSQ